MMRRAITLIALLFGLGLSGPALAQDEEGLFGEENGGLVEENGGIVEDDDAGVLDGGFGEDQEATGDSGFASDEYGMFDPDYDWDAADDEGFNDWYGEADDDWLNDEMW